MAARLPEDAVEKLAGRDKESAGQLDHRVDPRQAPAVLDQADLGPVDFRVVGKRLLTQLLPATDAPDPRPDLRRRTPPRRPSAEDEAEPDHLAGGAGRDDQLALADHEAGGEEAVDGAGETVGLPEVLRIGDPRGQRLAVGEDAGELCEQQIEQASLVGLVDLLGIALATGSGRASRLPNYIAGAWELIPPVPCPRLLAQRGGAFCLRQAMLANSLG